VISNSCVEMNKAATDHFNVRVAECRLAAQVLRLHCSRCDNLKSHEYLCSNLPTSCTMVPNYTAVGDRGSVCVSNFLEVALDGAAVANSPAISDHKSNALTTAPQSHVMQTA